MKPLRDFLSANGALLYYEVEGDGPPLVLLHGWALDLRMFDAQMRALSREYRVIRMDRRGFGRSSDAEDLSWNAADLGSLLDHLAISRAHVLGMSQGGRVALDFAVAFSDRVDRLILAGDITDVDVGVRVRPGDGYQDILGHNSLHNEKNSDPDHQHERWLPGDCPK